MPSWRLVWGGRLARLPLPHDGFDGALSKPTVSGSHTGYHSVATRMMLRPVLLFLLALICAREEMPMQVAHRLWHIALLDHEADIDFRCALGNHADVYSGFSDDVKDTGRNAGLSVNVFPHQADDRLLVFASHIGD